MTRPATVHPRGRRLIIRIPSDVTILPRMRGELRAFLRQGGLDESLVEDVVLCVQEACKNAVRHSRCDDEIVVRLALELWAVRVTVRDFGVGMGPHAEAAAPAPLAETGRGLHIIRCLMDELEVRVNDGTEVRMVKHLSPSGCGDITDPLALSA